MTGRPMSSRAATCRARAWLTEPVRVLAAMTRTLRGWAGAVSMSCLRVRVVPTVSRQEVSSWRATLILYSVRLTVKSLSGKILP